MPDIQTEMQKILQAWEQPETTQQPPKDTPMFTKTIGVSEATFNIVRDQPGNKKAEYIRQLEIKGFKKASTSSILSQMVKQGMLWVDSSGLMRPNQAEYTPVKAASAYKKAKEKTLKVKTHKKYKVKDVQVPEGIAALMAEHKNNIRVEIEPIVHDRVQQIMDTISLSEAKRLYKALNEYFGSV